MHRLKMLVLACGVAVASAFGTIPSREAEFDIEVDFLTIRGKAISDAFKPVYNPVTRAISDAGLSAQASSGGLPSPRKLNVQVDGVAVTDTRGRRCADQPYPVARTRPQPHLLSHPRARSHSTVPQSSPPAAI